MAEEDVTLKIENNILTIRGEKREEADDKRSYHVWGRRCGSFRRVFTLPKSVAIDEIKADFHNEALTVKMPKDPEAKSRTIEIMGAT